MDPPRIHFSGWFLADVGTQNNGYCSGTADDAGGESCNNFTDFNPDGTGEFSLYNCRVTSVVYEDGVRTTREEDDPIIGQEVLSNPATSPAKMIDIDPHHILTTMVFGMSVSINQEKGKNALIGNWMSAPVSTDIFFASQQTREPQQARMCAQGRSLLENLKWSSTLNSDILQQLKCFSDETGVLSLSFTLFNYTINREEAWFKYGRIVGSVGVGRRDESRSFPGQRVLYSSKDVPSVRQSSRNNHCQISKFSMNTAYFNVGTRRVSIDMGNSFMLDSRGSICRLDALYVGILKSELSEDTSVELISEVPYKVDDWHQNTAGVQDFTITEEQQKTLSFSRLVLFIVRGRITRRILSLCHTAELPNSYTTNCCAVPVLVESPSFVKPLGPLVFFLEKEEKATVYLKASHFGQPLASTDVKLEDQSLREVQPRNTLGNTHSANYSADDGLWFEHKTTTNLSGIVTIEFQAKAVASRDYMDGQVFSLNYCLSSEDSCRNSPSNDLTLRVFSHTTYTRPYFWDTDVHPIFKHYEKAYPAMSHIMALGNYESVTQLRNLNLIKQAMSLDFNHPSFMPASRDLSPNKRKMVLDWLNSPNHYKNWEHIEVIKYQTPPFCNCTFHFDPTEGHIGVYANESSSDLQEEDTVSLHYNQQFTRLAAYTSDGELPEWFSDFQENQCSLESLKQNLQDAVSLEFSTIPLYLTALYSIKDGYNQEVYNIIRSVVVQEMLHVLQVANILISIGGHPLIDSRQYAPSYPSRFSAGILPQLVVSLEKASPRHISRVFMAVEYPYINTEELRFLYPEFQTPLLTAGHFYAHIRNCVTQLSTERNVFIRDYTQKQVLWPGKFFDHTSYLFNVTDLASALSALEMIAGEGDGEYSKSQMLNHFFLFESVACRRHVNFLRQHFYCYNGREIEFDPEGVWPMRDNPSKEGIPPGTALYREAKHFHHTYRSLLLRLQEAFDGDTEAMNDSLFIMENMTILMKRLMQLPVPRNVGWPEQTCGPVFDYDWD